MRTGCRLAVSLAAWVTAVALTSQGRILDTADYAYTMPVSFPGHASGTPLTNFPVLIKLGTNITGISYAQFASPDGYDLRFTDADRVTELSYEIEVWDTNGTSCVWVQVPVLSGTNDTIHAYWGNTNIPSSYDAGTFNPASDISGCQVWYDASLGVQTDGSNVVTSWEDQSGNGHDAAALGGAPVVATNQLGGRPAVQFRKAEGDDYLAVDGGFFAKEMWMVWRSPLATFNAYGGMLGTVTGRESTFIVQTGQTVFHSNQAFRYT